LINGKPRFVAVDDWVPGSGRSSWFSHVEGEQDFWPLILEKDYAKIHGTYDIISGGWVFNTIFYIFSKIYLFFSKPQCGQVFLKLELLTNGIAPSILQTFSIL